MSNKIIENLEKDLRDSGEQERERVKRIALEQTELVDPLNDEERERLERIALEQTEPIDLIDIEERERVQKIALEQTEPIDLIEDVERERVERIALNKAADTDPINAAFNAPRDQSIKQAYYINAIQQLQNFINIYLNESFTFIDYFLLFVSIAFLIYFIYKNLNSRKDYI